MSNKAFPSINQEQKQEIIERVRKKGEKVSDLAKEYGIVPKTIYNLLSRSTQNSGALLELAKLKRENDALLKIVGELIVDQKLGKKIQHRYGR
jgi:transposase-like protein